MYKAGRRENGWPGGKDLLLLSLSELRLRELVPKREIRLTIADK